MTRVAITTALVVSLVALWPTTAASGQGWSADVSAGRLVYDPILVSTATNNLMASVRYDTRRETWVYGSGAVPAGDGGTVWGAAGTGGRVMLPSSQTGRARVGADVSVHGFSFRDRLASQAGTGGTIEATPFARLSAGAGFVDAHTVARHVQALRDRPVRQTVGAGEDYARPQRQPLRRLRAARPLVQRSAFVVSQQQRFVVALSSHGAQRTWVTTDVQDFF